MDNKYDELYEKLSRLQWLLGRHHMRSHSEHGPFADPTKGQGRVLAMLKLQPEISTKDLSYLLGIRQQSLNELLNKLERAEYVVRVQSETDRRVMMVKLTEKGKAGRQESSDFSGIFGCLSQEEQETFGDYLDRVIAALEAQLGTEEDEEEMESWMENARSRLDSVMLDRMMSRRGGIRRHEGPHGPHGGPLGGPHGGPHPHGPHCDPDGPHGPNGGPHRPHGKYPAPMEPYGLCELPGPPQPHRCGEPDESCGTPELDRPYAPHEPYEPSESHEPPKPHEAL